jgi:hypothetical protein
MKLPHVSAKLKAGLAPPLTAFVTTVILTGDVDKTALATLAGLLIGAGLGYETPHTSRLPDFEILETATKPDKP